MPKGPIEERSDTRVIPRLSAPGHDLVGPDQCVIGFIQVARDRVVAQVEQPQVQSPTRSLRSNPLSEVARPGESKQCPVEAKVVEQ